MTNYPLAGTPPVARSRNPTLIPNFDKNVNSGNGTLDHTSPAEFIAANPRSNATATATIANTATAGDILTLEVQHPLLPTGLVSKTYTVLSGDTVSIIAEAFAKLFNDDAGAQTTGLEVDAVRGVLTFSWPTAIGNLAVISAPNEGATTITVAGIALTGDKLFVQFSGPQIGTTPITIGSATTTSQNATTMAGNLVTAINANAALTALGISAANTAGVITMTVPAAAEPVTITAWVNTIAPTVTITGTVVAGDINSITVTGAGLTGGAETVNYVALLGDSTNAVAAGLAAAINADTNLAQHGVTATISTNIVSIVDPGNIGQLRFTFSTTGSESGAVPTAPTETITVGTTATETITLAPTTGKLSGGDGPVIPYNNFTYGWNGALQNYWMGKPEILGFDLIAALIRDGMPIA